MKNQKQNTDKAKGKAKAQKLNISQLTVIAAYGKTFSSGKSGFFGKVMDSQTGERYQIIGAVKIS